MTRSPVTRLRALTPEQQQRLDLLRHFAQLLDSSMMVPGTSLRFGLDPLLGLFPIVGDLVSPLFTIGLIWQARDLGVPRVVQARMVLNVAIDSLLGIVPVLGDLFDFAWKANDRNLVLLDRHAHEEHGGAPGDWLFVIGAIAALLVLAIAPFLLLGWLLGTLSALVRP